jgi:hypothetical protein
MTKAWPNNSFGKNGLIFSSIAPLAKIALNPIQLMNQGFRE